MVVKAIMNWAREYVIENGPLFMELMTYRYHGHSMSDPGITYRTKDEVQGVRSTRDPVEIMKNIIIDNKFATESDLKKWDKDIKKSLDKDIAQIKQDPVPGEKELYSHVGIGPTDIRGVEYNLSKWGHQ